MGKGEGGDFPIFDLPGQQKKKGTVFDCAEEGDVDALAKLVRGSRHFDVDAKDRYGRTILMWGSDKGHEDIVEKALDLGARVEITEAVTGRTAVHWAARGGFADIIQMLVDVGADIFANDKYGMNPLYLALQKGDEGDACAQLLMEMGAEHTAIHHTEILAKMTPEEEEQLRMAESGQAEVPKPEPKPEPEPEEPQMEEPQMEEPQEEPQMEPEDTYEE